VVVPVGSLGKPAPSIRNDRGSRPRSRPASSCCATSSPTCCAATRVRRSGSSSRNAEAVAGSQALEYARFLLGLAERCESLRAPHASLMSTAKVSDGEVESEEYPSPRRFASERKLHLDLPRSDSGAGAR
jgi:hypothetical protein